MRVNAHTDSNTTHPPMLFTPLWAALHICLYSVAKQAEPQLYELHFSRSPTKGNQEECNKL